MFLILVVPVFLCQLCDEEIKEKTTKGMQDTDKQVKWDLGPGMISVLG